MIGRENGYSYSWSRKTYQRAIRDAQTLLDEVTGFSGREGMRNEVPRSWS